MTGEVRRGLLVALAAALLGVLLGCGALVPYCDDGIACARGADGVWRCPPPGGSVFVEREPGQLEMIGTFRLIPEAERMEQVAVETGRADLVTWRKGWARGRS
jgi:hypothetical protein